MKIGFPYFFLAIAVASAPFTNEAHAGKLSVLTYNVWGAPFSGKKVRKRHPLIADALKDSGADVIALEEVFDGCLPRKESKTFLKRTAYPYFVKGPRKVGGDRCVNSGVLLLSKHPVLASATLIYNRCSGTDCLARKGVAYAKIEIPGVGPVDFYATHTNAGPGKAANVRLAQAAQIVEFIQKYSGDGERPVVLMGDLNAAPDSPEILLVRNSLGLRDVYSEYVESRDVDEVTRAGYTADPSRNAILSGRGETEKVRIDYLMVRPAAAAFAGAPVTVNRARMIFEAPVIGNWPLSDHFGVQGELEFSASR